MSAAEDLLAFHLRAAGIPYQREVRFDPSRKWRADFCVGTRVLVEVEGGIWSGGRHTRGSGFAKDLEKYTAASIAGFTVIRVSTEQVESGEALALVEEALGR